MGIGTVFNEYGFYDMYESAFYSGHDDHSLI